MEFKNYIGKQEIIKEEISLTQVEKIVATLDYKDLKLGDELPYLW